MFSVRRIRAERELAMELAPGLEAWIDDASELAARVIVSLLRHGWATPATGRGFGPPTRAG